MLSPVNATEAVRSLCTLQCCQITAQNTQSMTSCSHAQTGRGQDMWCATQVEDVMQSHSCKRGSPKGSHHRLTILIAPKTTTAKCELTLGAVAPDDGQISNATDPVQRFSSSYGRSLSRRNDHKRRSEDDETTKQVSLEIPQGGGPNKNGMLSLDGRFLLFPGLGNKMDLHNLTSNHHCDDCRWTRQILL